MIEIKNIDGIVILELDVDSLRGADLRKSYLLAADLERADLRECDLRGANLASADLYKADLRGANLSGANLYCANLAKADLQGADLHWASLSGAKFDPPILRITGSRDDIIAISPDQVQIGCLIMSLAEWQQRAREIGKGQGYTEAQVAEYEYLLGCVAGWFAEWFDAGQGGL